MFTKNFKQITRKDADIAGGKGASLGEMTQAGIPVPPGFVVLSGTFEKFLEETDLNVEVDATLHTVDHNAMHTVENASEKIQTLIKNAKMPENIAREIREKFSELGAKFVAVRSSATAEDGAENAWAGQLDSFLNTTEENLLEKVQHCWASLFTPRAIFYRFEKNLHKQKISVAVVVQKMVESEVSGIAFSVHPVTEDYNQIIIEAGFGLGEAIVSGQITPDSYVVEKNPRNILDINVSTQERGIYRMKNGGNEWIGIPSDKQDKQKLSEEQILELSEIIISIEKHYGFPCDIEWAFEDNKFYIVQSRPITTLTAQIPKDEGVKTVQNLESPITIESDEWDKIWTTEYSLFSIWLFANQYIDSCKELLGVGFEHVILQTEGELASLYRNNSEQKKFIEEVGKRFLDSAFREKAFNDLRVGKVKFEKYFKLTPEEFLTPENVRGFIELHNTFIPFFIAVIWAPEALKNQDVSETIKEEIFKGCEAIRKENENMYPRLEKFLRDSFAYIAQKEKLDKELLAMLLPSELITYVQEEKLPDISILKTRYENAAVDARIGGRTLLVGKDARDLIDKISLPKDNSACEEIKGNPAFPGIAIGKVRLIFRDKEQSKVQAGDILVTTMTRPQWIPAMKRAGAFVTDAGGVLSHAAIVAREMKKPCIIGTEIATQVLKDGDLVEVDADKGVVKIL